MSCQRDPVRIAPEGGDIALHPLERGDLIQQAEVGWSAMASARILLVSIILAPIVGARIRSGMAFGFGGEFRVGQKAEHPQPVVDRYDHQAFFRQLLSVVEGHRAGPFGESAAVHIDQNRQRFACLLRCGPDVQVQAILANFALVHEFFRPGRARPRHMLHASGRKRDGLADAVPRARRFGGAPAQRLDGRRGVGNPLVYPDGGVCAGHPGEQAAFYPNGV